MSKSVNLRGLPAGSLPVPGDFVYLPGNRVGIVGRCNDHETPASAVIAPGLALYWLCDYSMVLPLEDGAYVISRGSTARFVQHFMASAVMSLPQMATNSRLRRAVSRILSDPEGMNARGLFEFSDPGDNRDGCYDPALHQELRNAFRRVGEAWFLSRNPERSTAERVVAWAVIFSEDGVSV